MEETFRKEFDQMTSKYPGFRFAPTDVELISFYLKNKLENSNESASVIPEVEINHFEPWDLPAKCPIYSESEWYYFSPRGRKYPNGSQSKRATEAGYWKATGRERNVYSGSTVIGTKRTLVFHMGRAPYGERTDWIMHEYCLISGQSQVQHDSMVLCRLRKNNYVPVFDAGQNPEQQGGQINEHSPVEQSGSDEGMKVDCPKNNTSNKNSVDQRNDSELVSDKKFADEPSYPETDEEELYGDILRDNLLDLDDAFLPLYPSNFLLSCPPEHRRTTAQIPTETFHSSTQPAQLQSNTPPGKTIANRRVRTKSLKGQSSAQPGGETIFPKQKQSRGKKFPSCIVDLFEDKNIRFRYAYLSVVFIVGLLLLLWLVDKFFV